MWMQETPNGYDIWIGDDGDDYNGGTNQACVTNQDPASENHDWSTTHTCGSTLTGRHVPDPVQSGEP